MTPPVLRMIVTVASVSFVLTGSAVAPTRAAASATAHLVEAYGKLPLHFEANQGQTDRQVKFLSRGAGYSLFLTPREAVLALRPAQARGTGLEARGVIPDNQTDDPSPLASNHEPGTPRVLRLHLLGANPAAPLSGLNELPGTANYFVGKDPAKWRTHVPTFAKVTQSQVYPGIDLVYYGNQQQVEFDFIVAPGADPTAIRLSLQGAEALKVDEQGDLLVQVQGGEVRLATPHVYQEVQGTKQRVAARYILEQSKSSEPRTSNSEPVLVRFEVAAYDGRRPLVIDPTLVYSTYLGGNGDERGRGIAVDAAGAAYVTGETPSADFTASCTAPCTVLDATFGGGPSPFPTDAFVTKLNATGTALVYSTYLGGSGGDGGAGIAVDAQGAAYVTGTTRSADFTAGCTAPCTVLDATFGGGPSPSPTDAFVTKLDPTGSALVYSTYLGGSSIDQGFGIAVDAQGAAYVTGSTGSTDFTAGCTAPCTVLGTPPGGFVTKLNAAGTALLYAAFPGGSGRIAVDAEGAAYVMGSTRSRDLTAGCTAPCVVLDATLAGGMTGLDAFVIKLNATGTALLYSTYLGGNGDDFGHSIAVDAAGAAYVTGTTFSTDFTAGCTAPCVVLDATRGVGEWPTDAFVTKLDPTGSALVYSTYLGGNSEDASRAIAVDAAGAAYVTGSTSSRDFTAGCTAPCTVLGTPPGGFVTKLNAAGTALLYAAFLSGSPAGIAVDAAGAAYVTGFTFSTDFTAGCTAPCTVLDSTYNGNGDTFVVKISHGPAASGPVAHWKLDEDTGTSAADSSGKNNTGTLSNGPSWTTGRDGHALQFDGGDDAVAVAPPPPPFPDRLDITGPFTLAVWTKPTSPLTGTGFRALMVKNYTYWLYANGSRPDLDPTCVDAIIGGFTDAATDATRIVCRNDPPLTPGVWVHLAVTYDGSALRLYRDGVEVASTLISAAVKSTTGHFELAASQWTSPNENYAGVIDDARVYDRALSPAEIQVLARP
jgi:hypothetical protein